MPGSNGLGTDDPVYRVADPSEMFDLLIARLREGTEELADILKIARALADAVGSTEASVEDLRRAKVERAERSTGGSYGGPLARMRLGPDPDWTSGLGEVDHRG